MNLGFHAHFVEQFQNILNQRPESDRDGIIPARIIFEGKNICHVQTLTGELVLADVAGKIYHQAKSSEDLPTTGDWVVLRSDLKNKRGRIEGILPRKSLLKRSASGTEENAVLSSRDVQVLGANIDYVWIVSSLNQDLSLPRLERYCTMVWNAGAVPVVVLSKADLVSNPQTRLEEVANHFADCSVHILSAESGLGVEDLNFYLKPDVTVALLGSSGVGKSTIVNKLLGKDRALTQKVRAGDDKGRHTTTGRHLYTLDSGAILMDTPGLRELQLSLGAELDRSFSDISELAVKCKFSDCGHQSEPQCAVRAAIEQGTLSMARFESYKKLEREVAFQNRKADPGLMKAERERWKKISKNLKRR